MTYVNTEIADKYQEFFNFMNQEHDLILTVEQIDEIVFEAQRLVKKLTIPDVSGSTSEPINYCPKCKSNDIRQYTKTTDKCNNCNHAWYVYEPFKGVE